MKQGKNQTKIEKAQKMLSQKMAEKKKKAKIVQENLPGFSYQSSGTKTKAIS